MLVILDLSFILGELDSQFCYNAMYMCLKIPALYRIAQYRPRV